MLTLKETKNT